MAELHDGWCVQGAGQIERSYGPAASMVRRTRVDAIRYYLSMWRGYKKDGTWEKLGPKETNLWRRKKRAGARCRKIKFGWAD